MTRPTEYDARQKQAQLLPMVAAQKTAWSKPSQAEDPAGCEFSCVCCDSAYEPTAALPNSAGWGKSVGTGRIVNGRIVNGRISTPVAISRPAKVTNLVPLKNNSAFPLPIPSPITPVSAKLDKEKRKSASAAAMARGRSSDSTQSTTGSSAQTSPKRIPVALPIVAAATIAPAFPPTITPPPELRATSISDTSKGLDLASLSQPSDEPREESVSADSEAGPSSASPPPRTPARHTHEVPPPPLTSEPIVVHSPYEEPRIFAFPTSDPGFAFVLGLDDSEIQRQQAQAGGYQPSPFSKTLVGLAELGVLSPELPDTIALQPSHASPSFSSTFQPFDSDSEDETTGDVEVTAGPSRATGVTQQNVPRTSSRFDFARNTSFTASRGQSPFASMRRHVEDPSLPRDPWSGRQPLPSDALRSQQSGENRRSAMGSQASSFGSHGLGNENGWAVESPLMAQRQAGGFGRDERADGLRMEYGGMMGYTRGKGVRSDRDDFEPSKHTRSFRTNRLITWRLGMLHYGTNPSLHAQRAIFSPDGLLDDGPFHSFPQMNPQLHTPQGYPNSRAWQYQQQRAQSPSALTSHGEFYASDVGDH